MQVSENHSSLQPTTQCSSSTSEVSQWLNVIISHRCSAGILSLNRIAYIGLFKDIY